ncbi:hypothetical protein [Arthrobacter sp. KK5.5]
MTIFPAFPRLDALCHLAFGGMAAQGIEYEHLSGESDEYLVRHAQPLEG